MLRLATQTPNSLAIHLRETRAGFGLESSKIIS